MILLYGGKDHKFDESIARWVLDKLENQRSLHRGDFYAIGVLVQQQLAAGVLYHDYCRVGSGGKIELSFASVNPRWAHPRVIGALLYYPFVQVGCHVIVSTIKLKNRRCRRLAEMIGFEERGCIPNWPFAEDSVIYALRREKASRWLPQLAVREAA